MSNEHHHNCRNGRTIDKRWSIDWNRKENTMMKTTTEHYMNKKQQISSITVNEQPDHQTSKTVQCRTKDTTILTQKE